MYCSSWNERDHPFMCLVTTARARFMDSVLLLDSMLVIRLMCIGTPQVQHPCPTGNWTGGKATIGWCHHTLAQLLHTSSMPQIICGCAAKFTDAEYHEHMEAQNPAN